MNLSLDGYADHDLAIADDELHDFFTRFLHTVDVILFGRVTYQLLGDYWPHADKDPRATPSMLAFANKINALPKVVFSETLGRASWANTRLVRTDPVEEARRLKQGEGGCLSVGGISLIQTFFQHGLIDEYWLLLHPRIWGEGKRLFAGGTGRADYHLEESVVFHSGVVALHYSLAGR
jgi:dihydrofolate reductase